MAISMVIILALVAIFIVVPAFVVIAGIVVAVIIASTRKKDENVNKDITVNAEEITGA